MSFPRKRESSDLTSRWIFTTKASIIVAPHDADPKEKERADIICDGVNDEVELLASITTYAKTHSVEVNVDSKQTKIVQCYSRHAVQWLPGVYNLGETLVIPDSSDCVIKAEGTELQGPANGSAVIVHGMERCRYYFGTIQCNSTNADAAALKIKPTASMPALMSKVTYMGLWGVNKKMGWGVLDNAKETGTGLCINAELNTICWNEFSGTHIERVGTGIGVSGGQPCSNNRFWVSFIICVEECIYEKGNNVERNTWTVNVEAIKPDSFAVRTGAAYGKWLIILGTADWFLRPQDENNKCKSLILDPGAKHNLFEFHPPVEDFAPVVDKSGNDTNVILTTKRPPYRQ